MNAMKILIAHNSYQNAGGEDVVAATEAQFLQQAGHAVVWYRRDNHELGNSLGLRSVAMAAAALWSQGSYRSLRTVLHRERPDVAHFHNTFPLISPSAYYACSHENIPVVQTLHNYRLLCPSAILFRAGQVCERCLGRPVAWPGVVRSCYRGDLFATATVAGMLAAHRTIGSWRKKIDCYIALSHFAKQKFVAGGIPAERIVVSPNVVHPDPGPKNGPGEYALFLGRLTEEKGINTLLHAWRQLKLPVPLLIAGTGPLQDDVAVRAGCAGSRITVLGQVAREQVPALLKHARFLACPSLLYENFPVSIVEAFACGVPVIASDLGSMAEVVTDHATGLLFKPGASADLAARVEWAWTHPDELQSMGFLARAEYEAKYTAERGLERLLIVYETAIRAHARAAGHAIAPPARPSRGAPAYSPPLHPRRMDAPPPRGPQ